METFLDGPPHSKCLENAKNAAGLENLKGLKGKRIAQNMGTKIGLIQHIYYVIFCAGCPVATADQVLVSSTLRSTLIVIHNGV